MADGSVQCRLLAGKTRVAPKCKISIPRMELVGALLAVRLARKIMDSLRMELEAVRYFTDSSVVLGMLNKDSASFLEFVGTRVSEIRIKSDPDKEWFWIPGELNLADQGTRPTVLPKDMAPGTSYHDGLPWMRDPVEAWPVKKKFTTPLAEECRKDVLNVANGLKAAPGLVYPARATTRAKLERIYRYVFTAVARFKKLPAFSPVEVRAQGRTNKGPWAEFGPPAEKYRTAARQFLLEDAQTGLIEKQLESLMVEKKPQREEGFPERMIVTVGGRQKKHLRVAYDQDELPVLPPDHELARLYLQEAHELDHAGVDAMIMRSRSHVWITRIRPKAQSVKRACFTCRIRAKELGNQKMAPLPAHRMGPTPPFWSTAVDLFGPLSIVGTVNTRTTRKAWGVIFVCTATSLTHVEIAESYSTEAFLLALRRFMALHGAPKRFQSDQGTQLVAASKQVKAWDWSRVRQQADGVGAEWHVVPTGGQHFNGQAERMIGILKKCLEGALAGRRSRKRRSYIQDGHRRQREARRGRPRANGEHQIHQPREDTGGAVATKNHHEAHPQDSGHRAGRLRVRVRPRIDDGRARAPHAHTGGSKWPRGRGAHATGPGQPGHQPSRARKEDQTGSRGRAATEQGKGRGRRQATTRRGGQERSRKTEEGNED